VNCLNRYNANTNLVITSCLCLVGGAKFATSGTPLVRNMC
jgi:hypothetical protein